MQDCQDEDEEAEHQNRNGDDIGVHSETADEVGEQEYPKH